MQGVITWSSDKFEGLHIHSSDAQIADLYPQLQTAFSAFNVFYENITFRGVTYMPLDEMKKRLDEMEKLTSAMAKVADNCLLSDESSWDEEKTIDYQGSWYPYVRDIDPTMVIRQTNDKDVSEVRRPVWWMPSPYHSWSVDKESWMKNTDDLPDPGNFLLCTDDKGNEWINLQVYPDWAEPKKPGEGKYSRQSERIWYHITSLLVSDKDLAIIQAMFVQNNNFDFPEIREQGHIFSWEFYWSKAWRFFQRYYYSGAERFELEHPRTRQVFASGLHTTQGFRWEEEFDCSKEGVISFLKPSVALMQGLYPTRQEGGFANSDNELIFHDPSVYESGPSCLLVKKNYLNSLLTAQNLRLVWFLTGEKQIIGSSGKETVPPVGHRVRGMYHLTPDGKIEGHKSSNIIYYGKQ